MVVLDFFGIFYCCSRFRFELAFWLEGKPSTFVRCALYVHRNVLRTEYDINIPPST